MMNSPDAMLTPPSQLVRDADHFSRPSEAARVLISTNRLKLPVIQSSPDLRRPPLLYATDMIGGGLHASEPKATAAYRRMVAQMTTEECEVKSGPFQSTASPSVAAQRSLKHADKRSRMRLIQSLSDGGTHSPASFVAEITAFVQSQLVELDRLLPPVENTAVMPHQPASMLLPVELSRRRIGAASLTTEERRRKLRLEVFLRAQRMFAESFKTYQQFLEALVDENASYVQFLEEDLVLHKEVLLGQRHEMKLLEESATARIEAANMERDTALQQLTSEKERFRKQRLQQQEVAQREKAKETDARRQLFELEHALQAAKEELTACKKDCEGLRSENNRLSLQTFSDQLQAVSLQLQDTRQQCATKEEAIHLAHDEAAELMKDLRRVTEHFNLMLDYEQQLQPEHVRLSNLGFRALFPESSKKKKQAIPPTNAKETSSPIASPALDGLLPQDGLKVEGTLQQFLRLPSSNEPLISE